MIVGCGGVGGGHCEGEPSRTDADWPSNQSCAHVVTETRACSRPCNRCNRRLERIIGLRPSRCCNGKSRPTAGVDRWNFSHTVPPRTLYAGLLPLYQTNVIVSLGLCSVLDAYATLYKMWPVFVLLTLTLTRF